MTISKQKPGSYDANYDPRPKFISVGVSLISHEVHHLIQDDRHVEIPCEDAICYVTIPRELTNDWNAIALLVEEQEGYYRKHFKIMSVWECVSDEVANEIF